MYIHFNQQYLETFDFRNRFRQGKSLTIKWKLVVMSWQNLQKPRKKF